MSKSRKPGTPSHARSLQRDQEAIAAPNGGKVGVRFIVTAAVLMALLYGLYFFPYPPDSLAGRALEVLLAAQGKAAAWVIGWFDPSVSAQGAQIVGRFPMRVVKACSSLDAQALFVAAVVAFPARRLEQLIGVVGGVIALSVLNIMRIAALYFLGVHAPRSFEVAHEEILPWVLIVAACSAFYAWATWVRGKAAPHVVA